MSNIVIGVLALQGDFSKHLDKLSHLGITTQEIRYPEQLDTCDGLIIPGGESTAFLHVMEHSEIQEKIKEFSLSKPIYGTCAGLILMADKIEGKEQDTLHILNITIERNAYGSQQESFTSHVQIHIENHKGQIPALFIRAPRIKSYGHNVKVLGTHNHEPVLVQQGRHLGGTFHPELTQDDTIHKYFIHLIQKNN
jgi:5'-phosphate synthase pdxT subunit